MSAAARSSMPTRERLPAPPAIRPPDPAIRGVTRTFMGIESDAAVRRLVHLVFRDAHSALDLTFAHGAFWREPYPPGLCVTSNNRDPGSGADLHLDFTATGLPDGAYDLVVYDPPHIADGGERSIVARRFGTIATTPALRDLIVAGCREAWRVASVGVLVKVADHSHGGELLPLSDWVKGVLPVAPYAVLHTFRRGYLRDGKHRAVRVPRNNGATYLAFRKDGHGHRDFDQLYARQGALRVPGPTRLARCATCNGPLGDGRRDRSYCSSACRQRAYRQHRVEAHR